MCVEVGVEVSINVLCVSCIYIYAHLHTRTTYSCIQLCVNMYMCVDCMCRLHVWIGHPMSGHPMSVTAASLWGNTSWPTPCRPGRWS